MRAQSKILVAPAPNRIRPRVEVALRPAHYAFRSAGGANLHLTEVYDFIFTNNKARGQVERASLQIQGTLDAAAREKLTKAATATLMSPILIHSVNVWPGSRRFRHWRATPLGRFVREPKANSRGCQNEGPSCPFFGFYTLKGCREPWRDLKDEVPKLEKVFWLRRPFVRA